MNSILHHLISKHGAHETAIAKGGAIITQTPELLFQIHKSFHRPVDRSPDGWSKCLVEPLETLGIKCYYDKHHSHGWIKE